MIKNKLLLALSLATISQMAAAQGPRNRFQREAVLADCLVGHYDDPDAGGRNVIHTGHIQHQLFAVSAAFPDDGFQIAEVDVELRGPGETGGLRQSGQIEMLIGDLQKDGALIPQVRDAAIRILNDDPKLIKPENRMLREHYKELFAQTFDWSQIG